MAVRYVEIGQYPDVRREVRGNLSEILVATANPGTYAAPEDVTGCFLEMGTDGKWDGASVGSFGSFEELNALPVAYLAFGTRASDNGVQYTYGAAGWAEAAAGGGLTPYADYATLSAQAPTVGKIAQIPRLCGNGYFALRGNGTRWEVCPGESIVRDAGVDSAGYDLTATGTAYVPLASYTIPAGLIGNGEEWDGDQYARNNGVWVGAADLPLIRIGGVSFTSNGNLGAANRVCRNRGAFARLGDVLSVRISTADTYTNQTSADASVDLSVAQTIDVGIIPGAIGNTSRIRMWAFRRIG